VSVDNVFLHFCCGHDYELDPASVVTEVGRKLRGIRCPDCRDHPQFFPPPVGWTYRFALDVADGAPLTAERWPWLNLCEDHAQESETKGVLIPAGVTWRVGLIFWNKGAGGGAFCDVCDGNVSIVLVPDSVLVGEEATW
jgi:hypothetical protein